MLPLAMRVILVQEDALPQLRVQGAKTSELYLNLLQNRQGIRVEWYTMILILVEIVLIVYDLFVVR